MSRSVEGPGGLVIGLFAACAVAALPARGNEVDDLVGSWRLKFVSADGKMRESVLVVSRDGTALRGDYTADAMTQEAKEIGFERGELSFRVDGEYVGKSYTLTYKGKTQGDVLRGSVRWKFGWASGCYDFHGERVGPQVASNP